MAGVALSWGPEVYKNGDTSSSGARAGIEVIESLSSDGKKATYTVNVWGWTRWSCADSYNKVSLGGYWSGQLTNVPFTTSVDSSWSASNKKKLGSITLTIDRQKTAVPTFQTVQIDGIDIVNGAPLKHRVDWSAPALSTPASTASAPLAPTKLAPSGVVDPTAGDVQATWQHNSTDGSGQTAFELLWRYAGVTDWTYQSGTDDFAWPAGSLQVGRTVEWGVRTMGVSSAGWSPWATSQTFRTAAPPTVTITNSNTTVATSHVTLAWKPSSSQAAARLELVDLTTGAIAWSTTINGAATSAEIPVVLLDGRRYRAAVSVKNGDGLWSKDPATWAFSTAFPLPATPTATGRWDDTVGGVRLTISNPAGGAATTVSNEVWRSFNGGPEELVATGVPVNGTVLDLMAGSNGTNTYRVVAMSDIPSGAASRPISVVARSCFVWLSGGDDFATSCRVYAGAQVGLSVSRSKQLHQFAGRRSPLEFTGRAMARTYKVSGMVDAYGTDPARVARLGSWPEWELVATLPAPLLVRDPLGRREYVAIDGDVQIGEHDGHRLVPVSVKLVVVDHRG